MIKNTRENKKEFKDGILYFIDYYLNNPELKKRRISGGKDSYFLITIEELLKTTKDFIYIYSDDLNNDIFNDRFILKEMKNLLGRGGSIRIILESGISSNNKIIKSISSLTEECLERTSEFVISSATGTYSTAGIDKFIVIDNERFIYSKREGDNINNILSFNEINQVRGFIRVFNEAFELSNVIYEMDV